MSRRHILDAHLHIKSTHLAHQHPFLKNVYSKYIVAQVVTYIKQVNYSDITSFNELLGHEDGSGASGAVVVHL